MAASVQCRPQERTLGMVMSEVDKNLALFLEMRSRKNEKETSDEFDDSIEMKSDSSQISNTMPSVTSQMAPSDNCLNSENDKDDYDWLLTPLDTPLCPFIEVEKGKSLEGHAGISNAQSTGLNSKATSVEDLNSLLNKSTSNQASTAGNRRPSSSSGKKSTASRPRTPTARPSLPAMSKPVRASTPTLRASTPTSRVALPSTKTVAPVRSSTPTRAPARSSTPTARSSAPVTSKPTISRSATPTNKSSNRSLAAQSCPSSKTCPTAAPKNPMVSRGTSPTFRSRPLKSSEKPSLSHDAPNLKPSVAKRPSSASKIRPRAPGSRSSSTDTSSNGTPRQQSCSPSRVRTSNGSTRSGGSALLSRSHGHISDDVNPILMGTKMVERVVNMRKLAPPKQDDHLLNESSFRKFSTTQENSGFGRSLSKKSLDMAIRHMDITRSINCDPRPIATSASSVNARSGSTKSKKIAGAENTSLATSR